MAVSGSIVLLFASLGMVVYFADHLVHSIQLDAINQRIEQNTLQAIVRQPLHPVEESAPRAPAWAVRLAARRSGYVQMIHPEMLLPLAADAGVTICLRPRVGQHMVAGTPSAGSGRPLPRTRARTPRHSGTPSMRAYGSGSNGLWSRTSRSASDSRSNRVEGFVAGGE